MNHIPLRPQTSETPAADAGVANKGQVGRRLSARPEAKASHARGEQVQIGRVRDASTRADHGTPATRARLKPCPMLDMLARGHLTQEQYSAAMRIGAAARIITAGMTAKIGSYGLSGGGFGEGHEADWAVDVQVAYRDWVDAMAERAAANVKAARSGNRWRIWLPLEVIVDGLSCREIAERLAMKHHTVAMYLRDALDLYIDTVHRRRTERRVVQKPLDALGTMKV